MRQKKSAILTWLSSLKGRRKETLEFSTILKYFPLNLPLILGCFPSQSVNIFQQLMDYFPRYSGESNHVNCDTKFSWKSKFKNNRTYMKYVVLPKKQFKWFLKISFLHIFLFKLMFNRHFFKKCINKILLIIEWKFIGVKI